MGYTTTFEGRFDLDKPLTEEHARALLADHDNEHGSEWSDGYVQWQPTEDRKGIEWDGEEKFHGYVECLEGLIANRLGPWGYTLTGSVSYSGESATNYNVLAIEGGKVVRKPPVFPAWAEIDEGSREVVLEVLLEGLNDCHSSDEKAFKVAYTMLGGTLGDQS